MKRNQLSDGPPQTVEQPHYFGHRNRLRARFLDGGADALPDYEPLELALFSSLPRVDVKPLAKKLIAKFGGFADVIAAPRDRAD
jgi:DNA repair protein RadC